jgi:hypothetical protein
LLCAACSQDTSSKTNDAQTNRISQTIPPRLGWTASTAHGRWRFGDGEIHFCAQALSARIQSVSPDAHQIIDTQRDRWRAWVVALEGEWVWRMERSYMFTVSRSAKGFIALSALVAGVSCDKVNPKYCSALIPCPGDAQCDLTTHECSAAPVNMDAAIGDLSGIDASIADLSTGDLAIGCPPCSGTTPICEGSSCVSCMQAPMPNTACMKADGMTPYCFSSGACVECRDANDCKLASKAICDPTSHSCRPCLSDSDCASEVCDLTPGAASFGECVSNVVYVDATNQSCATDDGLTPAHGVCKISTGVMKAMMNTKSFIHIANIPNGSYNTENLSFSGISLTFVGEPGTTIKPSGNNPAFEIKGTSTVVVRGLTFSGGAGGAGSGVVCSGSSVLTVLQSSSTANTAYGIDAASCAMLTVDRATIGPLNSAGGIRIGQAFNVTNTFVVGNGTTMNSTGGVAITSPATAMPRSLINNTIADNTSAAINAGVSCPAGALVTIYNDILYHNVFAAAPSETNCTTDYVATDDAADASRIGANNVDLSATTGKDPAFVGSGDYDLKASSPCRDKGLKQGAPDHDFAGHPRPDASGNVDIGADEVQ